MVKITKVKEDNEEVVLPFTIKFETEDDVTTISVVKTLVMYIDSLHGLIGEAINND